MNEQEALAQNLIKMRKAAGLTQLELAEKIKYSNKTISKWERGESYPDIFTLKKIADVYGVTVNNILEGIVPTGAAAFTPVDEKNPKYQFNRAMLIMACALLFCISLVAFFLLTFLVGAGRNTGGGVIISAINAGGYGYWNFFIYNIPLDALAVFIFILVLHKKASQICLSLILWGLLCSIHLSVMQYEQMIALIYLCGVPFQILLATFCRYLNISLRAQEKEKKAAEHESRDLKNE